MPSKRSHQEGPKYGGKKTYFGYSGWHQDHINFQSLPPLPLPHMLQLMPRILLLNKLKKDKFRK
jgi:hypothetical protein